MDFYKECLVEKVMTSKERVIKYMIWGAISFALFALFIWGFVLLSMIGRILFLVVAGVLVLDKFYWNKFTYKLSFKIEYEYTLTNTTLDIDKIIAKSERQRMLSFDIKDIELMTPMDLVTSAEYDGDFKTVAEACADISDLENTYCIIADTDRYGRLRLTLTPNEGIIELMKPVLGRRLRQR